MYEVSFNIYEGSKKDEECKPIEVDGKEIYLSVGGIYLWVICHIHY